MQTIKIGNVRYTLPSRLSKESIFRYYRFQRTYRTRLESRKILAADVPFWIGAPYANPKNLGL